jgi:hypothetical protein
MVAGLVDAGLARAQYEIMTGPGGTTIKVVRIKISGTGPSARTARVISSHRELP